MSGGTAPGVMEEVWESSEEELSPLRSRFGDGFLIVSVDADGVMLPLSAVEVSGFVSPFSGWDGRIEVGF